MSKYRINKNMCMYCIYIIHSHIWQNVVLFLQVITIASPQQVSSLYWSLLHPMWTGFLSRSASYVNWVPFQICILCELGSFPDLHPMWTGFFPDLHPMWTGFFSRLVFYVNWVLFQMFSFSVSQIFVDSGKDVNPDLLHIQVCVYLPWACCCPSDNAQLVKRIALDLIFLQFIIIFVSQQRVSWHLQPHW